MEDSRKLQIAENNRFPILSGNESEFFLKTYQNYIIYSESLYASFFTRRNVEVQRNILRNNFGLTNEDISSWEQRANRYKMSSESFTLFLHIAMSSAMEGFREASSYWQAKRTKELGELDAQFQALNRRVAKLSKNSEKSKKKSKKNKKKSQQGSVTNSDISADEIDEIDKMVDDNNLYSEDRDLNINRPIVAASGSQSNVDHSVNMEVAPIEPVVQSDSEKSKPQLKQIPEKSSTVLTKSSNKNKRSNKNLIEKVITGHKPTDDDTSKVRDILVYDVPVSWTAEHILQQLTLWGKPIDIQMKRQRKYQTVRLKIELSTFRLAQFEVNENPTWTTDLGGIPVRWFPARWNLKERKQREKFQATIRKIPDSMTSAALWIDHRPHTFLSSIRGLKSFKIIQTARGERKLIGYFEKWVDMRNALDNQFVSE
ncbi:hypothetical protein RhiirA4_549939 [Rhizophagus irregularis]|uniref:Uncharacterized protein n=1 Tax=Rhizophagus irregularis TaxID=588596 RepID=A0A2I1HGW1_9GLOM|nr:hypothetical protein RhiirA4_549939 [Rhizophagus irregularis]